MIIPRYIIGFSGHRELSNPDAVKAAIYATFRELREYAASQNATVELYCSAAYGADLLALRCARELQIPIHLLIPMAEEEFAKDFADHASEWDDARAFMAAAKRGDHGGTFRILRDHQERSECYYGQAARIVEACDLLLVLWDGKEAHGLGGTKQVIDLAGSQKKRVLEISATDPAPVSNEKVRSLWPAANEKIADLNQILRDHKVPALADAAALQSALDVIANQKAPAFRKGIAKAIWMHSAAALVGAIPSLFYFAFIRDTANPSTDELARWDNASQIFTSVELVLVLLALFLTIHIRLHKIHNKWVQTRFAAELVRGVRASRPWLDPLHPQIARHLPKWRRFALTAGLLATDESLNDLTIKIESDSTKEDEKETLLAGLKKTYLEERLQHQRKHYADKSIAAVQRNQRWDRAAKVAAIMAPFFVLFALVDKYNHWTASEHWLGALCAKFLPVALPLLAGSATALRTSLDITRRAHRYPEMAERLQGIEEAFAALKTHPTCAAAVSHAEELLLDELVEWRQAAEHTGAH